MQISSKLFNQQQLKQFSSTTEELQDLQNKIATGENILRASDDPVGSVELSGLNVVKKQIEQCTKYLEMEDSLDLVIMYIGVDSIFQYLVNNKFYESKSLSLIHI